MRKVAKKRERFFFREVSVEGVPQGGRKFEILWEPNFPVNNFA